ncbi:MAG: peptidoglycan recognition protein family protein [Planctomycetota bacterium]|jgi:hypothetical protein
MFIFGGCINSDEPIPRIVSPPHDREIPIPDPPTEGPTARRTTNSNVPPSWIPPSRLEKRWAAIVIHHSDTSNGSAAIFDDYHKSKLWDGIGYDFVIGNGTNTGSGQVEVTFRWREQRVGAHCKTPDNWANEKAVGICLVGNFEHTRPTGEQMRSLVKLVRFLQDRYRIPKIRIWGHNTTPGARVTDCPGRMFPTAWLKSKLDF